MTHDIVVAGLILFGLWMLFNVVVGSVRAMFTSGHPWVGLIFFTVPSSALFIWAMMRAIG